METKQEIQVDQTAIIKKKESVVFRVESDQWALLFDPDRDVSFGLNPVGVLVWANIDGEKTVAELVQKVQSDCNNVPENVEDDVTEFVQGLASNGLIDIG
jgi:SynChlorMet cassette protein ScmD